MKFGGRNEPGEDNMRQWGTFGSSWDEEEKKRWLRTAYLQRKFPKAAMKNRKAIDWLNWSLSAETTPEEIYWKEEDMANLNSEKKIYRNTGGVNKHQHGQIELDSI